MAKWWEEEPVRFECQQGCFKCCMKPGVVYFDQDDVNQAAHYMGLDPSEFKKKYRLRKFQGYWEMEVEEGSSCRFLTFQGCSIHPVKPKQCRAYPFWKEHLTSKNYWTLVAGFCPGIGEGPPVPAEKIKQYLRDFRL